MTAACRTRARCRCTRPARIPRRRPATSGRSAAPRSTAVVDRGHLGPTRPRARERRRRRRGRRRCARRGRSGRARCAGRSRPGGCSAGRARAAPGAASALLQVGRVAAVEQAFGMLVLAAGDRGLQRLLAVLGDVARESARPRGVGRPGRRHEQRARSRRSPRCAAALAEVVEVAVQVDVLVRGAPPPREAVGVERVDVQHRHAGVVRGRACQAASPSSATCTPEPQKPSTPWQALLTTSSAWRRRGPSRTTSIASVSPSRPSSGCGASRRRARLAVPRPGTSRAPRRRSARSAGRRLIAASARLGASQASASRTHSVAPSGIRSSLKS